MKGNHNPGEYFIHNQHFWSWHPGGCHLALVDGSVRFLTYETDYQTYTDLSTRAGREVVNLD